MTSAADSTLALAAEAYVWGFPRMLFAKYLRDLRKLAAPLNRFIVARRLATPAEIAANVDTLYGFAWLDLSREPVVLAVPDTDDRYYSIQLLSVFSDNFCYIGRRTTGTAARRFLVVGPDWQGDGPAGLGIVRSPSRGALAWLRLLIDGEEDLPAANRLQQGFTITPLSAFPGEPLPVLPVYDLNPYFPLVHNHLDTLGARYFDILGDALAEDPPTRPADVARMARYAAIGIGPRLHPSQDPKRRPLLEEAVALATQQMATVTFNTVVNGWSVNLQVTETIEDPLIRASLNRFGIGTVVAEEAIYLMPAGTAAQDDETVPIWSSLGPDGLPFSGQKHYRLCFPPGGTPPVDAFWSLTMYTDDWALVRNPLNRYAIGDRTPGLVYGADGSLELLIQSAPPASGTSNWLPAPEGIFRLLLRAYQPRRDFIECRYVLPTVEITST